MGINGVGSFYAQNYDVSNRGRSTRGKSSVDDFSCMGSATSLSESSDNGKRIGLTAVGNVGYIAMYADSSTEQDPIVKVGDYEVRVKDVNPNHATKMEMFALMSYMDDKGLTNNMGMKSFNKMTAYSSQAEYNGYCSGIYDENAAWTVERDWIGILGNAKETFFSIPQTYEQGLTCQKLIDSLSKWCNISETYIPDTVVSRYTGYTDPDTNEKVPVAVKYVTTYSKDGISCREEQKVGDKEQSRKLWTIHFKNEEDLGKVKNFLEDFEEEQRLTFASQRTFWKDFLDGSIDLADFKEYFTSTNNGIIDYEKEIREGKNLREIMGSTYAGYLNNNHFVGHVYSEDELQPSWYRNGIINIQQVYDQNVPTETTIRPFNGTQQDKNYQELISEGKNEIYEKVKNGDTEESFQIGGSSFTEKEWDKLLAEVDDITEEMREAMREEHEKRFAEAVKETTSSTVNNTGETDLVSKLFETQNSEIKVSNFKEHETPNYKFVPEPDIGSGGMRILKNGQSVAVFSVDDLKIRVDEKTGTRLLISEMGGFGGAWYDAIPVDAELENGLAEAIGVDDIPEVELEGYYIGTHAGTGIQYVMRPGDEGRGGKVLLRNAGDVAKYNALAEEYYNRYPNLVTSQEAGRIYASFEICGMQERTSTGFVNIRYDSISYHDNFDYKKNWSAKLTGDTWDMLWQWLEENRSRMEKVGEFSTWGNIINKLGGSYERVWSDEELKQGYLNN